MIIEVALGIVLGVFILQHLPWIFGFALPWCIGACGALLEFMLSKRALQGCLSIIVGFACIGGAFWGAFALKADREQRRYAAEERQQELRAQNRAKQQRAAALHNLSDEELDRLNAEALGHEAPPQPRGWQAVYRPFLDPMTDPSLRVAADAGSEALRNPQSGLHKPLRQRPVRERPIGPELCLPLDDYVAGNLRHYQAFKTAVKQAQLKRRGAMPDLIECIRMAYQTGFLGYPAR